MDKKELGRRIKAARVASGLTLQQLADEFHFERQSVYSWEVGKAAPTLFNVAKLAEVLGVSLGYLVGRTSDRNGDLEGKLLLVPLEDRSMAEEHAARVIERWISPLPQNTNRAEQRANATAATEAQDALLLLWRRIPVEQRALALRVLQAFTGAQTGTVKADKS